MSLSPELRSLPSVSSSKISIQISEIQVAQTGEDAPWDRLISSHPAHSFFHGSAWTKVLREAYGFSPHSLVVRQRGQLRAVLPLMEVSGWLRGRRGISLPFTDECAPLVFEEKGSSEVLAGVIEEGLKRKWRSWECRGPLPCPARLAGSLSFYGHRLDLRAGQEGVFQRFDHSVQRAIRKGERLGVEVEMSSSLEALKSFYALHCLTRRGHGLPPQPFSFFRSIHRHILQRGHGVVALARSGGRPVASALYFHLGDKVIYKFGASDKRYQALRGNDLVTWAAVKWMIRNGFRELNFGRTALWNQGLRRFKLGWGTEEYPINYFRYDFAAGNFVEGKDRTIGWHIQVFRLMPVWLSRLTGACLYRHLA